MATFEQNGLLQYLDANGNMHLIYPVTKAALIQGHPGDMGALAADGSNTMTGTLDNNCGGSECKGRFYGNEYGAYLESITGDNAIRRLFIANSAALADLKSALSFTDEKGTVYDIFGKHNKPNGIYGGSSNIPYTVAVGAAPSSAGVLSISSDSGFFALVTYDGAVCVNSISGEIKVLSSNDVNFRGGNLYLNTNDAYVNYEGFPYHYQAL